MASFQWFAVFELPRVVAGSATSQPERETPEVDVFGRRPAQGGESACTLPELLSPARADPGHVPPAISYH